MKIDNIKDKICAGTYEGYVWYSNSQTPDVYDAGRTFEGLELDATKNPFVIEAMLYDSEKKISYSVKYVDGRYIAKEYSDLEDKGQNMSKPVAYCSNRMDNRKLKFCQYYKLEKDEFCLDMEVSQPYVMVFVGFEK